MGLINVLICGQIQLHILRFHTKQTLYFRHNSNKAKLFLLNSKAANNISTNIKYILS
jgi:hypothetical protein